MTTSRHPTTEALDRNILPQSPQTQELEKQLRYPKKQIYLLEQEVPIVWEPPDIQGSERLSPEDKVQEALFVARTFGTDEGKAVNTVNLTHAIGVEIVDEIGIDGTKTSHVYPVTPHVWEKEGRTYMLNQYEITGPGIDEGEPMFLHEIVETNLGMIDNSKEGLPNGIKAGTSGAREIWIGPAFNVEE